MVEQVVSMPVNLHEYEAAAKAVLPPMSFGYVAGGAGDEAALRGNRAAFDRWRIVPRVLAGLSECALNTTVLGQELSLPVMVAPSGFHRLMHPDGEMASARACRSAGTIYIMSTASNVPMEEVASVAGTWWFQLYVFRDREITRDLVQRAAAAGASALVITVDVPLLGRREADERNRFALPEGITWANVEQTVHRQMPATASGSGLTAYITTGWETALSWRDIDWLASLTDLPVILKGILHPDDARLAIEHGARGIVVSNHGGRQLDSSIASLDALPAVVEAADGHLEMLIDSGFRRGTDVLKALALGARSVLIGRSFLWGLAVDGEAGATHVLELLRAELTLDLMLSGRGSVAEVDRSLIAPAGPLG